MRTCNKLSDDPPLGIGAKQRDGSAVKITGLPPRRRNRLPGPGGVLSQTNHVR
jgi:hypothetical protein